MVSKEPKSAYYYAPKAQVPGQAYAVLQYQIQYYLLRNFGILCARYKISPVNLQRHCDGCGISFRVTNAVSRSIGGLIIARPKKICDELFYLSRRAFTSAYVRAEPLIHQVRTRSKPDICQGSDKHQGTWGDVIIRGLWDCKVDAIIYVKLGDADVNTCKYEPLTSLLARWEKIKKDNHD